MKKVIMIVISLDMECHDCLKICAYINYYYMILAKKEAFGTMSVTGHNFMTAESALMQK